jgi:hypothetical protein
MQIDRCSRGTEMEKGIIPNTNFDEIRLYLTMLRIEYGYSLGAS